MEKDFCKEFENKVLSQITKLVEGKCSTIEELNAFRIGVAVSGGADSISLLTVLNSLFSNNNIPLYVISVNHNIRQAEETCGDAVFVENYCKSLRDSGGEVYFTLVELAPGIVNKTAEERGEGIEEAARFLRYEAFEKFINENNLDYLCLAHNKNDQEETLLMRFLQGSGVEAASGIVAKREKYIRPLIEIERNEIENYLTIQNIKWRTDSTNFDTQYLRNKIRLELVPFLNGCFPGWKGAVNNGGRKASVDGAFILDEVEKAYSKVREGSISVSYFLSLHEAIQYRILIQMFNECGCSSRIPYVFIKDVLEVVVTKKSFHKQFGEYEIFCDGKELFVKKICKTETDLAFFDIIEESGIKAFPFGIIAIETVENGITLSCNDFSVQLNIDFPFCIRNLQIDDSIECKDGRLKKVIDIYSDWKIGEQKRNLIPLIQELKTEKQELKCIFGEPFGFYNWVVSK